MARKKKPKNQPYSETKRRKMHKRKIRMREIENKISHVIVRIVVTAIAVYVIYLCWPWIEMLFEAIK